MADVTFRKMNVRKAKFGYMVPVGSYNLIEACEKIRELTLGWPQHDEDNWYLEINTSFGNFEMKVYLNNEFLNKNFEAYIADSSFRPSVP